MQRVFNPSPHHCFTQLVINILSQTINKHPPISLYAVLDYRIPLFQAVNYSDFKDSRGEHYLKVKIITQISFKTNQLYLLSFISHYSIGHKRTCASESLPEGSVRSCQYVKCRQLKLGEKKTNLITEV